MSTPLVIESPRSYAHAATAVLWPPMINAALPLALSLILAPNEIIMGSVAIPNTEYFLSWGVTWDPVVKHQKKVTIELAFNSEWVPDILASTSIVPVKVAQVPATAPATGNVDDYTQPTTYEPDVNPYINNTRWGDHTGKLKTAFLQMEAIQAVTTNMATLLVVGNGQTLTLGE